MMRFHNREHEVGPGDGRILRAILRPLFAPGADFSARFIFARLIGRIG